ncbi:16647_t:CDS:2 [Gigaspora margarita]|uniref:16647_t:CDS:1 n=1 Tax=Gigaspora margarita TaxID=4874 RepID=A0ABM8W6H1_GIGMA|nr:16647_t:CDS:2 [Gigaspora margarita]
MSQSFQHCHEGEGLGDVIKQRQNRERIQCAVIKDLFEKLNCLLSVYKMSKGEILKEDSLEEENFSEFSDSDYYFLGLQEFRNKNYEIALQYFEKIKNSEDITVKNLKNFENFENLKKTCKEYCYIIKIRSEEAFATFTFN